MYKIMEKTYLGKLFDVIIVGASTDGIALCEYLVSKKPDIKTLIVAENTNNILQKHKLENTIIVKDKVIYSSYNHGVIGLNLESGDQIFATNIVIATGTKPKKINLNTSNVYYKTTTCNVCSKSKQAIVVGDKLRAVSAAIWASKKFRYVYLCSKVFNLKAPDKDLEKLAACKNVVHLPNCSIVDVKNNKYGELEEVTLDTYSTIKCSAVLVISDRLPDVPQLHPQMLEIEDGYIKINHQGQTTKIPKLFALGGCTKYKSKRNIAITGKTILKVNNWKQEE